MGHSQGLKLAIGVLIAAGCKQDVRVADDGTFGSSESSATTVGDTDDPTGAETGADAGNSACEPGSRRCQDGEAQLCENGDWSVTDSCTEDGSGVCDLDDCLSPCEAVKHLPSYKGCEFWPTILPNPSLPAEGPGSDPTIGVVVSNPNSESVEVVVERGELSQSYDLDAGELKTIALPYSYEDLVNETGVVAERAFRMTATLPVFAYQFAPLEYALGEVNGETLGTYTNDASLLLPTSALGLEYITASYPTSWGGYDPMLPENIGQSGFVTVVATDDDTRVTIRAHQRTMSSFNNSLPALGPGQELSVQLQRGDALQISGEKGAASAGIIVDDDCAFRTPPVDSGIENHHDCVAHVPQDYDMTGMEIEADKPIAVFSGHECTFVPNLAVGWCDHLEEQLPPVSAWDSSAIAVSSEPQVPEEENVFRVISGADDNRIEFHPAVHEPVTLDRGDHVTFSHQGAVVVDGTDALLLVQYMPSEDQEDWWVEPNIGDPSMSIALPVEQLRTEYDFLASDTFVENYVNVLARPQSVIRLDGELIDPVTDIEGSDFGYVRIPISGGNHRIESEDDPFGITVYGVAPWTSYMYPGGLDLKVINEG